MASDGSPSAIGFAATGEPAAKDSQPLAWLSGMLDVQPQKDGPLMVPGNVELVSGTGRTVNRATRVFFGRCGQSRTKPCCDNSHKSVGFIADPG